MEEVGAMESRRPSQMRMMMKNRYWVVRHGKSVPNDKGIIVSSMENGVLPEYQLAPEGIDQARLAGERFLQVLKENNIPVENVRICYSPFARTAHTARVMASVLNLFLDGPQCSVMEDLRERSFGPIFELQSYDRYAEIWALDEKDPFQRPEGGECVYDVATRLTKAISDIETEYNRCAILVVSHGDPLQILQTLVTTAKQQQGPVYAGDFASSLQSVWTPEILSQHRKYALLTGELRALA